MKRFKNDVNTSAAMVQWWIKDQRVDEILMGKKGGDIVVWVRCKWQTYKFTLFQLSPDIYNAVATHRNFKLVKMFEQELNKNLRARRRSYKRYY